MRVFGWFASAITLVTAVALPLPAAADSMDPALERLVSNTSCRTTGTRGGLVYNPASGFTPCATDDAAFAKLIAQYGFAVGPTAMHSARTTGFGGFEIGIETAYTTIDSSASYWQNGTQGPQDPVSKNFSTVNKTPDSMLQVYSAKIRKGFPFGLELIGQVGYLANTNIITGGADVRMSLLEGFRTGIPAIFPEIAVGGSVRTITGTDEFQLTVAGFDGQVSKPFAVGGTVILTPYVGYSYIRIFGDSGLINLTPNTDAVNYCGFTGINTPANPDPTKTYNDGQPVCAHGSAAAFNNTTVFAPVRLNRHRMDVGLQLRFQMVEFGSHFLFDVVSPEAANQGSDINGVNEFQGVANQWTLAFDLGAVF
jgi:hypothetical protein